MLGKGISWFESVPRKEQERREKQYYKRMFPLGERQKDRELELLRQFSVLRAVKDQDLLYHLVCVKECLQAEEEEEREENLCEWRGSRLAKALSREARNVIIALAVLEEDCESLEQFPSKEQIDREARRIFEE